MYGWSVQLDGTRKREIESERNRERGVYYTMFSILNIVNYTTIEIVRETGF